MLIGILIFWPRLLMRIHSALKSITALASVRKSVPKTMSYDVVLTTIMSMTVVVFPKTIGTLKILPIGTALCPSATVIVNLVGACMFHPSRSSIGLLHRQIPDPVSMITFAILYPIWHVA